MQCFKRHFEEKLFDKGCKEKINSQIASAPSGNLPYLGCSQLLAKLETQF